MSAAFSAGQVLRARALSSLRGGRLEAIKWLAFGFMLVDHVAVYAIGVRDPLAEFLGAMAFPLFAFCIAVGVAGFTEERRLDVVLRLAFWAVVAQFASVLVRDAATLNVLCTFAAALALDLAGTRGYVGWQRLTLLAACGLVGWFTEFAYPGVLLAFALVRWARTFDARWLLVAAAAQLVITAVDGTLGAWFAPVVVGLVWWSGASLPRIKRLFYPAYAFQFYVMWLLSLVLA